MLQAPSKHDLRLILSVCFGDLLHRGMVESHSASQRSPGLLYQILLPRSLYAETQRQRRSRAHLKKNVVLLADLDDVRVTHERVQIHLVDGRKGDTLVDELLDVLDAKVGDLLREFLSLFVNKDKLTPIDLTSPSFCASTHARQTFLRISGPPIAECMRYKSKYSSPATLSEFRRSRRVSS